MESPKTELQRVTDASNEMNERNDCAVRAVAHASGVEYHKIHSMFRINGRRARGRTYQHISDTVMQTLKMETKDITQTVRRYGKTIKTAQQFLTRGTYLVSVRGHILCIKGGAVMDWADGRQHRITQVLEVINPGTWVSPAAKFAKNAVDAPVVHRMSNVKEQIWDLANIMWSTAGKPTDKKLLLKLRKRIMDTLGERGVKRTTASNELGNWQKSIIK